MISKLTFLSSSWNFKVFKLLEDGVYLLSLALPAMLGKTVHHPQINSAASHSGQNQLELPCRKQLPQKPAPGIGVCAHIWFVFSTPDWLGLACHISLQDLLVDFVSFTQFRDQLLTLELFRDVGFSGSGAESSEDSVKTQGLPWAVPGVQAPHS